MKHPHLATIFVLCGIFSPQVLFAELGVIEGDMYLLTRGGEVKQGAANEVLLLPQSPALGAGWQNLCDEQRDASQQFSAQRDAEKERLEEELENASRRQRQEARQRLTTHLRASMDSIIEIARLQSTERSAWIRSHAVAQSPTGMRAHYRIEMEPGEYWLFAEMPLANDTHRWLIPISVAANSEQTLDLDNNNTLPGKRFSCDEQPFAP